MLHLENIKSAYIIVLQARCPILLVFVEMVNLYPIPLQAAATIIYHFPLPCLIVRWLLTDGKLHCQPCNSTSG
jgi:hypothetical protein